LNFSFIDTELMNEINKQKDSDKKEVSLFKNNNLYFIYYQSPKNLFTINFQSDNGFTLEVPNFNKKSKNILMYLKRLVTEEKTKKILSQQN